MTRATLLALLCCVGVAACQHRGRALSDRLGATYTVGPPWHGDGSWFYPAEQSSYEATGLAVVDAPAAHSGRPTADGERYDPQVAAAAHQTLQLPVMVRVEDLENGRSLLLRINDRGPPSPGRLLSVTPRAARLLGMVPGRPAEVRVVEVATDRDRLGAVAGLPQPVGVAAPVGAVLEQSLMSRPPPVASADVPARRQRAIGTAASPDAVVTMLTPAPSALWIEAGRFSTVRYARQLAQRLGGGVRETGRGRSTIFDVRVGPFYDVGAADAALDRALRAGVTGARIIVE